MATFQVGELFTLCLMSLALGMDAFSVSLGLGMQRMSMRKVTQISLFNGFFHMLMPLLGILIGRYLSHFMGELAVFMGGMILIFFGVQMIYSSLFAAGSFSWLGTTFWGLLTFSIGVSLDSFSVGLSLGFFSFNTWLAIVLFGLSGLILTGVGIWCGKRVGYWFGHYSEAAGGVILVAFGLTFLL